MDTLFIKKLIGSAVRHGLTAAGAFLVAKGVVEEETAGQFVNVGTEVVVGAASVLIGLGWSALEKYLGLKALKNPFRARLAN